MAEASRSFPLLAQVVWAQKAPEGPSSLSPQVTCAGDEAPGAEQGTQIPLSARIWAPSGQAPWTPALTKGGPHQGEAGEEPGESHAAASEGVGPASCPFYLSGGPPVPPSQGGLNPPSLLPRDLGQ